jgi:hypothetical protein
MASPEEIREIVKAVLDEQGEREAALAKRIFDTFLIAVGIDPYQPDELISQDLRDLRATLAHSDKWRKSVNQVTKVGTTTAVTVLVTGTLGALWLGFAEKLKTIWPH